MCITIKATTAIDEVYIDSIHPFYHVFPVYNVANKMVCDVAAEPIIGGD